MANNAKLEKISVELAKRLNDAFDANGSEITAGDVSGKVVTASTRMAYINKAMFKLFNDVWVGVKGDKRKFAEILPELIVNREVTVGAGGSPTPSAYVIANPNFDFFQLIEASIISIQAAVLPSSYYQSVKYGKIVQMQGDATNPVCIEVAKTIYFLPDGTAFQGKGASLTFIRMPINGVNGYFLAMDSSSTEDSPFLDHWNSRIAELAEELFRIDAKE